MARSSFFWGFGSTLGRKAANSLFSSPKKEKKYKPKQLTYRQLVAEQKAKQEWIRMNPGKVPPDERSSLSLSGCLTIIAIIFIIVIFIGTVI